MFNTFKKQSVKIIADILNLFLTSRKITLFLLDAQMKTQFMEPNVVYFVMKATKSMGLQFECAKTTVNMMA